MALQAMGRSSALGAVVSIVAGALPFVSFIAPLLGGIVAGSLLRSGPRDGLSAGALMGGILGLLGAALYMLSPILPAIPAGVVLGPWARGFGLGLLGGPVASLAASMILLVGTGAVGGAVGGAITGRYSHDGRGAISDR